jgi:RNA 2',3'-cyclic 3'-phosphodiesterase
MRLFTGVDLPEDVREKLERLLMHLRPCAHLKWSPVYNLHVTLKFIGEWPEEKLPELGGALRGLVARDPIPAEVKGLGWYPNPHHPRVFWVGVQGGEALPALVKDIDAATAPLGIAAEDRAFADQGAGAAAGFAKRDRGARVRRIWRVPSGPILSLPQPARAGRLHLYQAF